VQSRDLRVGNRENALELTNRILEFVRVLTRPLLECPSRACGLARPSCSSGAPSVEAPLLSAPYESRHIRDWSAEEVKEYFRKLSMEFKIAFHESSCGMTGSEICALDDDTIFEFLERIGFTGRYYFRVGMKLCKLIAATPPPQQIQQVVHAESSEDCRQTLLKHSKQFVSPYIDRSGMLQRFTTYIATCLDTFQKAPYSNFAPYVSLVQSSGYGKSRLLRETAKQIVRLYICLRPETSNGFPGRTSRAEQALFGNMQTVKNRDEYVVTLIKRLTVLCKNALKWKSQLVESPLESSSGHSDEHDKVIKSALFPSERLAQLWDLREIVSDALAHAQASPPGAPSSMILALDEARELLLPVQEIGVSRFRLLREALRKFSMPLAETRIYGLIAVFVDTNSNIQNFTPNLQEDHSAREGVHWDEMNYKDLGLFHPFIIGETFDIHLKEQVHEDLSAVVGSREYLNAGRPLVSMECSFEFLQRKLLGGKATITPELSLGVVLCRVAAFVCPRHSLAVDLVAGHMATLLACDVERKGILSTYAAEPKLAIAAAMLWNEHELFFPRRHGIPALQSALASGALSQGIRGEILLLLAFDAACKTTSAAYGDCVDLVKVLEQLLPSDSAVDLNQVVPQSLWSAKVACCQFVELAHEFSSKTRILLAERHCGACFREGHRGANAVIPILATEHGFLMIQFKNLSSCQTHCGYSSIASEELLPSNVFADGAWGANSIKGLDRTSIRLFVQVGARSASAFCTSLPPSRKLPAALEIFGLGSRCLSKENKIALCTLVHGNVGLSSYLKESADLEPNPDPGFASATNSWPFVIERGSPTLDAAVKVLFFLEEGNVHCAFANTIDTVLCRATSKKGLVLHRCTAPRQLHQISGTSVAGNNLMQHRRCPSGTELGATGRVRKKLIMIQQPKVLESLYDGGRNWSAVARCRSSVSRRGAHVMRRVCRALQDPDVRCEPRDSPLLLNLDSKSAGCEPQLVSARGRALVAGCHGPHLRRCRE
jgi:hypothetical protein